MLNPLSKQYLLSTFTGMSTITQLNVSEKGEKLMQNCFRDVYENIVNKRLMENVHYVQTMTNVHTYRLCPGKMRGPACEPAVHDVIGWHRLIC